MSNNVLFNRLATPNQLSKLKIKCLESLTRAPDGMWESFRDQGAHFEITTDQQQIGYAILGTENELLQFYLLPKYLHQGSEIFHQFISQFKVERGMVGTNHPVFLSLALHFVKELKVHTYLFTNTFDVAMPEREATLQVSLNKDLERLVDFYHDSMDAPKDWLNGYLGALIGQGAIFVLEKDAEVIGACEVRISKSKPNIADLGMVISPDFRKKGYGSYLLNKAKAIALEWQKIPICSCEKENIGSQKAIQNCGFVSQHQLLQIDFMQE